MKRDKLIFIGFKIFGKINFLNNTVRLFYIYILIPLITFYFKKKHSNIIDLRVRNSIFEIKAFNFFLSDIDSTMIIKENTDSKKIIKDFIFLKKVFIMLDYPEVYTQEEYELLLLLNKKESWKIVELFWNLRKINWCKENLNKNLSELEHFKMQRSINKSFEKILIKKEKHYNKKFFLSDFKYLNKLFSVIPMDIFGCFYSSYLGNDNSSGVVIELSRLEYLHFNSLLPGEILDSSIKPNLNQLFLECKDTLLDHERLITISSIRLNEGLGLNTVSHLNWLNYLNLSKMN